MRGAHVVQDIRLLKLAEMYEEAYERFVLQLATRVVQDPAVRAELMRLVDPSEDHGGRIVEQLLRLNESLTPEQKLSVEMAAVEDVIEVERTARDFYLSNLDHVHDPEVGRLFHELAQAESRHVRIAENALALARHHAQLGLRDVAEHAPLDASTPLWEGSGDLGAGGFGLPPPVKPRGR